MCIILYFLQEKSFTCCLITVINVTYLIQTTNIDVYFNGKKTMKLKHNLNLKDIFLINDFIEFSYDKKKFSAKNKTSL